MPSKSLSFIKCIIFVCSLLFALTGFVIFFIGIMVQINYSHYSNFVNNQIWTVPIILIFVGAILTLTCFLGCCGSIKENSWMILLYGLLAFILFVSEVILGFAGYARHSDLKQIIEEQFNVTIVKYTERDDYRDAWALMQTELECCGIYGPTDWQKVYQNNTLPAACCPVIILNEADNCTYAHSSSSGCLNKLLKILNSNTLILAIVVLSVALIQILTISFSCCLYRSFR